MKEQISALWDGELDAEAARAVFDDLKLSPESRAAWRECAVIRAALRNEAAISPGFQHAVMRRLESEPTVVAPLHAVHAAGPVVAPAPVPARGRVFERYLPMAAGIAGVALVGWMGLRFLPAGGQAQLAQLSPPAVTAQAPAALADLRADHAYVFAERASVDADRAYMLAHQAYAGGQMAPGVAYYVRTVAEQPGDAAR